LTIEARFEPCPADGRGARRRLLHLGVSGRFGGADAATVHNLSASGLLIETATALAEGETIVVDLPECGARGATVVWADAPMHGCRFDHPLPAAVLSAAQLRSAVRPVAAAAAAEDFGARFHRLRTERRLSLGDIARRLGVSKPTVWAWEHGKSRPVERRLAALAEALGVAPEGLEPAAATGAPEALERGRREIAEAYGVEPARVRIMIEL
jgi:transcriptional regulator with XRE-family HTH domain